MNPIAARMLRLGLPLAALVIVGGVLVEIVVERSERNLSESRQEAGLDLATNVFTSEMASVHSDLEVVSTHEEVVPALDPENGAAHARLAREFVTFARSKRVYAQVQLLGADGRERVRVSYRDGRATIAPENELLEADARDRALFSEALEVPPGSVLVSPFRLGNENGAVLPPRPLLRLVTSVTSEDGGRRGVVSLDYLARQTLENLGSASKVALGAMLLLDREGYFLRGRTPDEEWGQLIPARSEMRFGAAFPDAWKVIQGGMSGRLSTSRGSFVYRTIRQGSVPTGTSGRSGEEVWKIVSMVPAAEIVAAQRRLLGITAIGDLVLLLIIATAVFLVASQRAKVEEAERQALSDLREAEERYRLLFERNLAGVYRSTLDGRLLECNGAFLKTLGFESREELDARRTTSLYADPKDRTRLLDRLLAEGFVPNHEMRLLRKDGSEAWVLASIGFVPGRGGSPGIIEGAFLDISDRKRAEEAIVRQKTTLETVLATMAQAMLIVDGEFRVVAFNRKFEPFFAFAEGEMRAGERLEPLVRLWAGRTNTSSADLERVLGALRKKEPFVSEFRQQVVDRPAKWIQLFHNPRAEGGFVRTYADITEQKNAEEAVRAAETRMRALLDNMLGGLLMVDGSGVIELVNPAAERIFGYDSRELIGKPLHVLVPERPGSDVGAFLRESLGKAMGRITEWEGRRKNGEVFPFELALFQFETPEGRRIAGSLVDVTERREVDRLKREFVSSISHELRTPLTSIRGSLGLLAGGALGPLSPDAAEIVAVAERNVVRLIGLINDILDLERLEGGRLEMAFESSEAAAIVERSLEAVRGFARQSNVVLVSEPVAASVRVRADADRLVQVLVNLVSNAVKFSPAGGAVTVRVALAPGMAEFQVEDRGRGVPPALREAIFERYRQVEASDSRRKGGAGLGLAICKAIVEQHGGAIGVRAAAGAGSLFWFRIPLVSTHRPSISGSVQSARGLALLVDDDEELLSILELRLAQDGVASQRATSAREAIAAAHALKPDLLVLDLGLPDGDGSQVIEALRGDGTLRDLPLLVYTGRDLPQGERDGLVLGPTRFLTKSRETEHEFRAIVLELLASRRERTA